MTSICSELAADAALVPIGVACSLLERQVAAQAQDLIWHHFDRIIDGRIIRSPRRQKNSHRFSRTAEISRAEQEAGRQGSGTTDHTNHTEGSRCF